MRAKAFAQDYDPSPVDRFGVWLSARQIRRWVPRFAGKRVADVGCGYHASFMRSVLDEVAQASLFDVALAPDLVANPRVKAYVGPVAETLATVPDASLDVVMVISVLEHVWDPLALLSNTRRVLAPEGTCLINVPSWKGKRYLERAAFQWGVSPASEMDDHKMYYDDKDLWPLLVRAGFAPSRIRCFSHKFGLNTFAVCTQAPATAAITQPGLTPATAGAVAINGGAR